MESLNQILVAGRPDDKKVILDILKLQSFLLRISAGSRSDADAM